MSEQLTIEQRAQFFTNCAWELASWTCCQMAFDTEEDARKASVDESCDDCGQFWGLGFMRWQPDGKVICLTCETLRIFEKDKKQ